MVIGFSTINHTHILGHPHFVHSATRLHDGQSGPPGIRLPCSREHFGSSAFEPRFKGTSAGNPHHLWQQISTLFPVPPSPKVSKSPKFIRIPKRFPNFGRRVRPFEVQNMSNPSQGTGHITCGPSQAVHVFHQGEAQDPTACQPDDFDGKIYRKPWEDHGRPTGNHGSSHEIWVVPSCSCHSSLEPIQRDPRRWKIIVLEGAKPAILRPRLAKRKNDI